MEINGNRVQCTDFGDVAQETCQKWINYVKECYIMSYDFNDAIKIRHK